MATYTQTTTIANGNSADGGEINTEIVNLGASVNDITDAQINSAAGIQISKTELGTFTDWANYTPTVYGATSAGVGTYTVQVGRWCQIGKVVFFSLNMTWTAHTGTGSLYVAMPKTAANNTNINAIFPVYADLNIAASPVSLIARIVPNTNYCTLIVVRDDLGGATVQLDDAGNDAATLYFNGSYEIA